MRLSSFIEEGVLLDQVVFSNEWSGLANIHEKHVNFGILTRGPVRAPVVFNEMLTSPSFRYCQMVYETGSAKELVGAELDFVIDSKAEDALLFYEDVMNVAEKFAVLSQTKAIGIRLEIVESNNCQNFHIDRVPLRLVTTYAGPGTEWLKNDSVNRQGLGSHMNDQVILPGSEIQKVEPGWIGIMKGETYPGNLGRGLVHRSPSITGASNPKRILLRMDALMNT